MKAQAISVKELRENLPQIRRGLGGGMTYLLIYRSQPIAEIKPLGESSGAENILEALSNPPKKLMVKSDLSSVELVRAERD